MSPEYRHKYSVLGEEVMTSDVLDVVELFLGGEIPVKGFPVHFFLKLLVVGLFGGNFHILKPLGFLLLELFAILIDLDGLLVKDLFFGLLHFVPPVLLLLLLPPPDVGLDLLHSFTISAGCIALLLLRSYPAIILRLLGPRICPWSAWL